MSSIEKIKTKSLAEVSTARLFLYLKFSSRYFAGFSMKGQKRDSECDKLFKKHAPKKFSTTKMSLE
ncbi:hypothetical protein HQ50_05680 [Porphyromonas sp. COT-052 OH4946]|nr:hypothetical protein HQ50_05680 [Porphyromonas sp. COT-052 OH4946]